MTGSIGRRGFLLRLLGLAGAGATAGLAIGKTLSAQRQSSSPVLYFNGRKWHTHEAIDHLVGTWDIRWCYRPRCDHTVEQIGTKEDGRRLWHLREFRRPPEPTDDPIPPGSIDRTPPLRRYFQDDESVG